MTLSTLTSLLTEQLQVLYAVEHDLCRALPKLIEGVSSGELKSLLKEHLHETERHAASLDSIASQLQEKLSGARCRAAEALLKEAVELTDRRGDDRVIDAGVLAYLRAVKGFEMTCYEVAHSVAEVLNETEVFTILAASLLDERRCEQTMTVLFEDIVDSLYEGMKAHPTSQPGAALEG